jgi:localization factor PodJL
MKAGIPWSVKGVGEEAREAAKSAARLSGMTLGEWLNSIILDHSDPGSSDRQGPRSGTSPPESSSTFIENGSSLAALGARLAASEDTLAHLATFNDRVDTLERQLAQLSESEGAADNGPSSLAAVDTALRSIVDHIEISERRTHEMFQTLQSRISEVASRAFPAAGKNSSADLNALEKLASQVPLLAERIEEIGQMSEAVTEQARLAGAQAARGELKEIEIRIEQLLSQAQVAMRQTAGASGDLTKVRDEIGRLAQRLDDMRVEAASERDVERLRLAVQELSKQPPQDFEPGQAADFDRRLRDLAHRLEQAQGQTGTPKLRELEQRLSVLDQRLGEMRGKSDSQGTGMLERQARDFTGRLATIEQKLSGIAGLERSINQLHQSVAETRDKARNAATETTNQLLQDFFSQVPPGQLTGESADLATMQEGLEALQRAAQQSDQQTQETLQAVHETLEQIINKLAEIEDAQAALAQALPAGTRRQGLMSPTANASQSPHNQSSPYAPPLRQIAREETPELRGSPLAEEVVPAHPGRSSEVRGESDPLAGHDRAQSPPVDDYIAAARRAAQGAGDGVRTNLYAGASDTKPRVKDFLGLLSAPTAKKSRTVNGAAIPVEVAGTFRKRLILAGLVVLATGSALFAFMSLFQRGDIEATSVITIPAERATGEGGGQGSVSPPKARSPQSWLLAPEEAESGAL